MQEQWPPSKSSRTSWTLYSLQLNTQISSHPPKSEVITSTLMRKTVINNLHLVAQYKYIQVSNLHWIQIYSEIFQKWIQICFKNYFKVIRSASTNTFWGLLKPNTDKNMNIFDLFNLQLICLHIFLWKLFIYMYRLQIFQCTQHRF